MNSNSNSPTTPTNDVKELDNILFRFALTDNGVSFNKFLDSYLVDVIGRLASSDALVKKKVMEVLSNINKRTMFANDLIYPIDKLLALYRDSATPLVVRNFAIVYIEKAFNSLPKDQRQSYLTAIVDGLSSLPIQHQDIFCHIILSIILTITSFPKIDSERDKLYPFKNNEKDCNLLLDFFLDFLMIPTANLPKTKEELVIPPGHSMISLQRIMGKNIDKYDFNSIVERKMSILNFLASGLFADTDVIVHFIIASTDIFQEVNRKGEDTLRRLPKINWENPALIKKLYFIFQGTSAEENKPVDQQRKPGSSQTREKILHYFCKSLLAANSFPATLQIIFESVYGSSSTMRLKHSAMTFVQWVFRHAEDRYIQTFGPIILSGLLKLLDSMDNDSGKEVNELKSFTYTSLGLLCKRNNSLFNKDLTLVLKLMSKIGKEESLVSSAIQDCLVMIREAFIDLKDQTMKDNLIKILMKFIYNNEYLIRYIVLQWAQHCFPFENVASRYFSLVMVGDVRPDIREEARRGLEPYEHNGNMLIPSGDAATAKYPDFKQLLNYIVENRKEIIESKQKIAQGVIQNLGFTSVSFEYILTLLRTSMRKTALSQKKTVQQYLNESLDRSTMESYMDLIESALVSKAGDDLYLLFNIYPAFIEKFVAKIDQLNQFLKNGKYSTRELIAKMIGLVASQLPQEVRTSLVEQYLKTVTTEKDQLEIFGPLYTLAYMIAKNQHDKKPLDALISEQQFRSLIEHVKQFFKNTNVTLKVASIACVGIIGLYAPIPYLSKEEKESIIKELATMLEVGSERGVSESVLISLGWISLGDPNLGATRKYMVDCLFKQVNNKNEELQFTVGDTLSLIIGEHLMQSNMIHPFSPFTTEELKSEIQEENEAIGQKTDQDVTMTDNNTVNDEKNQELVATLERILSSYFSDRQSPVTRCSAGTWMLCILKNFGSRPEIQSLLPQIQNGFCSLLADNNELTQDIASKGLTLVYESSNDPKFKEFLVSNLSKTLAGKPAQKAPGSSELLPEGAVGKTGQVATFKELSTLSTDLGKPDMIYKFMNLSSHHQIWNSKKGASFAIVSLASKAKEEFAPLLPYLVPKIYRYIYDPSPKIATSMKNIMSSIIDAKDIFPKYFEPIIKDLIQGMGQSAWRVREASCAAIPDTISHASSQDLLPYIEELFYMNFRTLDDIKESVRKAAESSIKSLGTVTSRLVDPTSTSKATAGDILKVVLPLLLEKGISNESKEVKIFTIQQLQKITNTSKDLIRPYVPQMVHVLLESLSSMESAAFNYATMHAESYNLTQEQLEKVRIEVSKSSPLNDILETLIKYIDQTNISDVMLNIIQMIQFSVGVVTRVGVAKFISNLFQSRYVSVDVPEPLMQKLINAIFPSIMDKSPATRRQFVATLCITVKKSNNTKLMKQTISQVMGLVIPNKETGEIPSQGDEIVALETSGIFFRELYKIASTEIQPFNKDLIPFLYFFRSHPKPEVAELFKTIWDDNSIGNIKLYTDEIIKMISINLLSSSWTAKQQGALCLSNLTNDIKNMMHGHLPVVLDLVAKGLLGKTYSGKDTLLESMSAICIICCDEIKSAPNDGKMPSAVDILTVMIQECKKSDLEYKRKALANLSKIISAFKDIDVYQKVSEILYPILFEQEKEKKDDSEEVDPKTKPMMIMVRTAAYNVIGEAYSAASKETQVKNANIADKLLENLIHSIWSEQVSILAAMKLVIHSLWENGNEDSKILSERWVPAFMENILECLNTTKYTVVKKSVLDLIEQIITDGKKYSVLEYKLIKSI
ncbi:hypothetical protein PPL_00154 [Heterostelium album PN500]|uniref:Uncharacterized protein n=1 Tax=Heterostelium pallidum (strain ATCC 26659 / Pp 5 / PN500) TaxID=670386 RepID=D3AVN9_HETP5|nr:hypothetical protein PPL_00154 [Heterostelium album PN500]EFA86362.1 hypothetical protein PPL_00154 [Heterostelium album PN500]|eukprot:XP_020438467.1 hypothetical protein PPL_00154 [Heterostelium album PN500]